MRGVFLIKSIIYEEQFFISFRVNPRFTFFTYYLHNRTDASNAVNGFHHSVHKKKYTRCVPVICSLKAWTPHKHMTVNKNLI